MKLSIAAAIALLTSTANGKDLSKLEAVVAELTARLQVLEAKERIVFVTSEIYLGNLGGIAGAHSKCQALANAAGISGTFRPWLSSSTLQLPHSIIIG